MSSHHVFHHSDISRFLGEESMKYDIVSSDGHFLYVSALVSQLCFFTSFTLLSFYFFNRLKLIYKLWSYCVAVLISSAVN